MGELRESSLLFSLQSLLNHEKERVVEEAAERLAREREAERQRAQRLREAERAETERKLADERKRCEEEERARTEAARLEALRLAEVERIRNLAELRAEQDRDERVREHERKLAAIGAGAANGRARWSLVLAGLLAFAGVAALASLYFGKLKPLYERLSEMEKLVTSERARADQAALTAQQSAKERAVLALQVQAKKDMISAPTQVLPSTPKTQSFALHVNHTEKAHKCNPNDPMDFCL